MRIGTGKANLKFPDGHGLYGFGPRGGRGLNVPIGSDDYDVLQARALYLEDGARRLLIVSFDLPSGSRVVHRAMLDALADVKLADGELWIVGTHTHSGPGHYFSSLYDLFGQHPFFYRQEVAKEIVKKGVLAARQALANPIACRVGVARRELWGAGRNRSLGAFLANWPHGDPTKWPQELGVTPPADATPEERAVDPRLTVIAFTADDDGRPLATWATWCCHAASIPRAPLRAYHRDWPGVAVDGLEAGTVPFAMIHQSANGDVTALPSGRRRVERPMERVREIGDAVGAAWRAAFAAASAQAQPGSFELAFRSLVPEQEKLPVFEIGTPVIVGSEELDPGWFVKAVGEARKLSWRGGPQGPKRPAIGPLQFFLRAIPAVRPSPRHPMWLLRIGSHVFFASPFEQTTYAAHTIEKAVRETWKKVRNEDLTASPIGLVGDYAGYLTTPAEYALQNYEGGHTLYGHEQLAALSRVWTGMITASPLDATAPAFDPSETQLLARAAAAV